MLIAFSELVSTKLTIRQCLLHFPHLYVQNSLFDNAHCIFRISMYKTHYSTMPIAFSALVSTKLTIRQCLLHFPQKLVSYQKQL
jgi:hypothetical protein